MKKHFYIKFLLFSCLLLVFGACTDEPEIDEDVTFPVSYSTNYQTVFGKPLTLQLTKNAEIKEVSLFMEDSLYQTWTNLTNDINADFDITTLGLGAKRFTLKAKGKNGQEFVENQTIHVLSDVVPQKLTAKVVTLYPHNPKDFTQGLEIVNGILYESTGDPDHIGATRVIQKKLQTGETLKETTLDGNYFGEGITILDNKLYQLTWTSQKCFVYDPISLNKSNTTFAYTGEGWGLTNNGKEIIMSDGSERLFFRNPNTFQVTKVISVYNNAGAVKNLNELEYVDGKIYANIWMSNQIVVIDAQNGKVLQTIDCSEFAEKGKGNGDVLNGIAFDKKQNKFYLTGKYWAYLAEVIFN